MEFGSNCNNKHGFCEEEEEDHHHLHQQQQWGSTSSQNYLHPVDRFHGSTTTTTTIYEGFNNLSNQRHEFMDMSPPTENIQRDVGNIGSSSNNGNNGNNEVTCIQREHMFDKVVTPSDVGKLNRLVIPKQHAEKYFPLDSTANEKGLLLSFEDRSGKPWRFRYSYWNSSQSYVMTKGWSRFVKEKKLDAGDIVTFERGASELMKDRLFIDWRRRTNAPEFHHLGSYHNPLSYPRTVPWGRFFLPQTISHQSAAMPMLPREHLHLQQMNYYEQQQYSHNFQRQTSASASTNSGYGYNMVSPSHPGAVYYLRSSSAAAQQGHGLVQQSGIGDVPMVFDSVPVVQGKAAAKRVRLFGVNLECPIPEDVNDTTLSPLALSPQQLPPHPHLPPHLQLRVYNGAPLPSVPTELPKRGRSSSLSFDLDI